MMAGPPDGGGDGSATSAEGSGRRLTLSPIGFDIVLALSQAPGGLRLAEIGHVTGSPPSSVQTALRILLANRLVDRIDGELPRYRLSPTHPARTELAALASVLPEPERALGIVLRANPAVTWAGADAAGFVVGVDESMTDEVAALDRQLGLVRGARPDTPVVLRMSDEELRRLLRVSLDLRVRVRDAVVLRGGSLVGPATVPRAG